ncbi:MAG: carbohydrate ABC transporter permease, partial [Chloroflexota bacterium]|nr:carbohydrate ABC transporter permease [Chloroflexota bacterium]
MAGPAPTATSMEFTTTLHSTRLKWIRRIWRLMLYIYLTIAALIVLIPYFWMASASLKEPGEIFQVGVNFLPKTFYTENYRILFSDYQIVRWLVNSFVVAGIVMFTNMTFTVTAGYAFARLRFKGRDVMFFVYVGAMMVPLQVRLIPSFIIVKELGWLDTY